MNMLNNSVGKFSSIPFLLVWKQRLNQQIVLKTVQITFGVEWIHASILMAPIIVAHGRTNKLMNQLFIEILISYGFDSFKLN